MAIAKCRECGAEVSDSAKVCPKCGVSKPVKRTSIIVVILLALVIFWAVGEIIGGSSHSGSATTSTDSAGVTSAPNIVGSQWSYSHVPDTMSKGIAHHAVVSSANTVQFQFPYAGEQHGTLELRTDPRYGKDVIFSIEKGQILCRSYEACTVLVRFDDERAINYSAFGAADNSTESAFLRNYDRFVGRLMKAKRVRISTNIYQEGAPVFEFDVAGFDPEKYKSAK